MQSGERKRKFRGDESHNIMSLLKRLHLDRGSELYTKAPVAVVDKKVAGSKRWRLSPISEYGEECNSKRRRLDAEMADQMSASCWISKKRSEKPKFEEKADPVLPAEEGILPENITSVEMTLKCKPVESLENTFFHRKVREQALQVVLWKPPLSEILLPIPESNLEHPDRGEYGENDQNMC